MRLLNKGIMLQVVSSTCLVLSAATVEQGYSFLTATSDVALDSYKSSISRVYSVNNQGSLIAYDGSALFNFALSTLTTGNTYLINANTQFDMPNTLIASDNTRTTLNNVALYSGYNISSMPVHNLSEDINGAIAAKVYATNSQNSLIAYDASATFNFALGSTIEGNYYLLKVDEINASKYLQSTIQADADLSSYTTTNLNNKSILVMENNSTALKTSLITFSSDQTYKEVEVSNFSASTLNGSDADINATVSSAVGSLTTGTCGNWNFDETDLNMTPVDDSNTPQTTVQIADSSDGNFTIGSTYKKVVYYGAAIDLSNVTDCQLDSFLLPPSVPN